MKISHEVPLDLLENSLTFNDYDYLLPHYYIKYPKYKEFYLKSRSKGRFIIMDNGLFEGGVLDDFVLRGIINEVKPNIFIVPDEWNDLEVTYELAEKWVYTLPSNVEPMVVLQGKRYADIKELYTVCEQELGFRHFGFNHSSEAYDDIHHSSNRLISKMMGRIKLIERLTNENVLNKKLYHHLLGCTLPQEMMLIDKSHINSVDTSNPIICGIKGMLYTDSGLEEKPKEKIEEFMEKDLSKEYENIIFNINKFKQFSYV
jgi:hypothetical protein